MDRKQATKIIKECKEKSFKRTLYTLNEYHEALDMAIEALEQEPCEKDWRFYYDHGYAQAKRDLSCEGAISRQAAIDAMATWDWQELYLPIHFKQLLEELPSVSTEKTGRWIKSRDSYGNNHFTCPFCEHDIATKYAGTWNDNYCPNCGARLVEPQESEDV